MTGVPSQSATGYKAVSINEPHFMGHFPEYAVMPGVLIVEAMAQTAAGSATRAASCHRVGDFSRRLDWRLELVANLNARAHPHAAITVPGRLATGPIAARRRRGGSCSSTMCAG